MRMRRRRKRSRRRRRRRNTDYMAPISAVDGNKGLFKIFGFNFEIF